MSGCLLPACCGAGASLEKIRITKSVSGCLARSSGRSQISHIFPEAFQNVEHFPRSRDVYLQQSQCQACKSKVHCKKDCTRGTAGMALKHALLAPSVGVGYESSDCSLHFPSSSLQISPPSNEDPFAVPMFSAQYISVFLPSASYLGIAF